MTMLHKLFGQKLNVVIIVKTNLKTLARGHVILFSSDLELAYDRLIDYYKLRFQIEFNFRDVCSPKSISHLPFGSMRVPIPQSLYPVLEGYLACYRFCLQTFFGRLLSQNIFFNHVPALSDRAVITARCQVTFTPFPEMWEFLSQYPVSDMLSAMVFTIHNIAWDIKFHMPVKISEFGL